ncbi:hypothetical protein ACFQ48_19220 [Hymenobacter caeli]|uniref:TonB C-terminal domain-containing protein n=1 Tax=Hymenobacter caeli TaxID=2735894 RepID=A0ABX2FV13_9BACT|nr:hypothetical protein [Hymenobacter caeli]NRT21031.1 hypothetical protein [Hymenobacter caeli]
MKNCILGLALGGGLLLAGPPARAQTGEYAAPGFPMLPQRRAVPPAPAEARLRSPVLPRFWHEADPDRQAAGRTQFFDFVSAQAKYPEAARPPKNQPAAPLPTGRLLVRVLVRPDGSVRQPPRVTRRELARPEAEYRPAALQALDAEALRVLGALRFVRSKAVEDSLVVPIRFVAE